MMNGELRIDPLMPADVAILCRLVRELAEFEHLAHEMVATEVALHAGLFGPAANVEAVLIRVGEDAAGFALWFHNFSTFAGRRGLYLEDLYVRPEFRGRGFGRRMLAHLAALAVERGCARLEWSVLDWNLRAVGFYRAMGAVPMSEWTVFRLSGDALQALADRS
jgi:GNAT superfamily N-acetyltransferase